MFDSYAFLGGIANRMTILLHFLAVADRVVEPQLALAPILLLRNYLTHSPPLSTMKDRSNPLWYVPRSMESLTHLLILPFKVGG